MLVSREISALIRCTLDLRMPLTNLFIMSRLDLLRVLSRKGRPTELESAEIPSLTQSDSAKA